MRALAVQSWLALLCAAAFAQSGVVVQVSRNDAEDATPAFKFGNAPGPLANDAAAKAKFTIVEGAADPNSGGLETLGDGKLPMDEDQPKANFFFNAGTGGGRILIDLGDAIEVERVSTYSWHNGTRAPQLYKLYGTGADTNTRPAAGANPEQCGWSLIAAVDTRPKSGRLGGQYAVTITNSTGGVIGKYHFLLVDAKATETDDPFGNTFFSEIDVVDRNGKEALLVIEAPKSSVETFRTADGNFTISLDVAETPELADWAKKRVVPMALEWYPRLVTMVASDGFRPPGKVAIDFSKDMNGVAATTGSRIRCAGRWFKQNLDGEALGAVFHELVHVVQQYGGRRRNPDASRPPGWLTEGIADYLRWYHFEPQSKGAEISARNLPRARYDGNYRISANFLNWVSMNYAKDLVPKLNSALRNGEYKEDLWKTLTGKSVEDLGQEWRAALEKTVGKPGQE